MDIKIKKENIKQAILIVDPNDDDCKRVATALTAEGITFQTKEIGSKKEGYGVDLAIVGGPNKFTSFFTKLTPPILFVEHSSLPKGCQITVFESRTTIGIGLNIALPRV